MKHRICYLSHNYRGLKSSGNKAKHDNEITLSEMGAVNLGLPTTYYSSKIASFFLDLTGVVKFAFSVRRGDILVLQYPLKKYFTFVCNVAHSRGAKVVALIHDLGSMRRKKLTIQKEYERLMHADFVIASNETMKEWISRHGYSHGLGALGLFDFRSDVVSPDHESQPASATPRVVYAGALAPRKNLFLLGMQKVAGPYSLEIYGNREGLPGLEESASVHFHPFMKPEEFIAQSPGDYGLVWDGDSLDTCSGHFGEYLHWNSPHKASFYLRAGMPLIVWRQSALAPIVEQEGIGICIDNIGQLGPALKALTDGQRAEMLRQVRRIDQRLRTGDFLKKALTYACQALSQE
jgi:glycosyltransferase involved in cell wall biosynthesis